MRARGGVRAYPLFLQYDADPFELAAQRRGQFRDRAFYVPDLPESGVDRFDDVHRHTFDRALRDTHLQAHDLVDREVVDRLFDIVFRGHVAQFGRDLQIDRKAVADLALQFVTAVQRPELHASEDDTVLHAIRRSRGSNSSCRAVRAGICPRSDRRRSPGASRRRPSPC